MRSIPSPAAFSLVELLVVVGLLALLAGLSMRTVSEPSGSELEVGQVLLIQMLDAARLRAAAGPVRLLVHNDAESPAGAERYLNRLLLQEARGPEWTTIAAVSLPRGVRLLPGSYATPTGLWGEPTNVWVRGDGRALRSTALRAAFRVAAREDDGPVESWVALGVTPVGTTFAHGDLVLASARPRPKREPTEAPVELRHPERVRGVSVSVHAVALPIQDRHAF